MKLAGKNKKVAGVLCVGALGAGLLAGYSALTYVKGRAKGARRAVGANAATRRCIVGMFSCLCLISYLCTNIRYHQSCLVETRLSDQLLFKG